MDELKEMACLQSRLADYYLGLAEEAAPKQNSPDRVERLDRLEREHHNWRTARQWWVEQGEAEPGLQMLNRLYWFRVERHLDEGQGWYARFLTLLQAAGRSALRAEALDLAAGLSFNKGMFFAENPDATRADYAAARALGEEGLAIRRELDHTWGIAATAGSIADLALDQADFSGAYLLFAEALASCRALGEAGPGNLEGLAAAAAGLGQPEQALRLASTAAAHREASGGPLSPNDQARLDQRLAPAREALDEVGQAAALAEGRAITLDQAIAEVLRQAGPE